MDFRLIRDPGFLFSFALFTCIGISALSQGRFDDVQIKTTQLTEQVYMLEGSGGNIGVFIGDEAVLMVDDQFAPLTPKIVDAIRKLSDLEIRYVANTHWHGDHTGGNENLANQGAVIVAHEEVYNRMSTSQERGGRVTPPSPLAALPRITFNDEMSLFLNGEEAQLIHVGNAHTDGDSFVWFPKSNVLHMGDTFFHQRFPYIDLDSGGSVNGAIKAVEAAVMLVDEDTQIIPGHGPMAGKADLENYLSFLKTVRERVNSFVEVGRGMDAADPAKIIEGYEDWGWGFINAERLTSIFFDSLSNQ